jgi:mono/diheme cytochrome c family protein
MRRTVVVAVALAALCAGAFWGLTRPVALPASSFAGLSGDAARGEAVFHAGGCASCHMAPGATGDDRLVLSGGQRFVTDFGTFVAPNISSDRAAGIGGWSVADLGNAMLRGLSPEGDHYYPAFPYTAYARVTPQDVADLHAYLATLPADATPDAPHELAFPFTLRRGIGLWKRMYLSSDWVLAEAPTPELARGRYLVEALGHCAECHTPRDRFGGPDRARWLAGAPNPGGEGRIPDITPATLTWSEGEIVAYLTSGFTPDYDSAGGHMALVVENFARLPESDRAAVAAYLKAIPAGN